MASDKLTKGMLPDINIYICIYLYVYIYVGETLIKKKGPEQNTVAMRVPGDPARVTRGPFS